MAIFLIETEAIQNRNKPNQLSFKNKPIKIKPMVSVFRSNRNKLNLRKPGPLGLNYDPLEIR